jgi:hypothetical protein
MERTRGTSAVALTTGTRIGGIVGLGVLLLAAPSAFAGAVAPSKPSQEVLLGVLGGSLCTGYGVKFDTRVNSDGSSSAFTIPSGEVLVLDRVNLHNFYLAANAPPAIDMVLHQESSTGQQSVLMEQAATTNASFAVSINEPLSGIVVKPGVDLCGSAGTGFLDTGSTLHGFLTKDK